MGCDIIMGAVLYKECEAMVGGKFRMKLQLPIPLHHLLESLGLSWWTDIAHLLSTKDLIMNVPEIREFLALVKNSQQVFPDFDTILKRHPIGVGTTSYWHGQYAKARRDLIEFLEANIEAGTPIELNGVSD